MSKQVDMTGWVMRDHGVPDSKWIVIDYAGRNKRGNAMWNCVCECGTTRVVEGGNLRFGTSKSCGCSLRTVTEMVGEKKTRLYHIWHDMHARCNDPNDDSYKYYGAKGVVVCNEWHDYVTFKRWALSNGYDDALSIDRIDSNGNYEPENCRWSDYFEQNNNRSNNVYYEVNGERLTVPQLARMYGIKCETVHSRLGRGWDIVRALTEPLRVSPTQRIVYNETDLSVDEWAQRTGLSRTVLINRIRLGWPPEEILFTPKLRQGNGRQRNGYSTAT